MKTLLLVSMLMLAGCQTTGGSYCDLAEPIWPDNVDALSDANVAGILAHDLKGEKLCGWKP